MSSLFRLGQALKGRLGTYIVQKQLHESVWLATYDGSCIQPPLLDQLTRRCARSLTEQRVVIKSVRHFRLHNERDILKRFQHRTSSLRPLVDEIRDPADPPALVLHEDHYVHTDIKLDNVLVNYGDSSRFSDVQLADCGNTVRDDSVWAKDSDLIGAPVWRSPESMLQIRWGTPTDIWPFGVMIIALIYSGNFFLFKPDVPAGHEEYELRILMRHHQFFGPFPESYAEIANSDVLTIINYVMNSVPADKLIPVHRISERELCRYDKDFVLKIMRLDPRDRPTARQLADDPWLQN